MSSTNPVNVGSIKSLFANAVQDGDINADAANIMINGLNDTNILGCTGVAVDDLETDSVTLSSILLDDSFSMKSNEMVVREAYDELVINAMKATKQAGSMLVSARTFSTAQKILYDFKKVADVGKIGSQYVARGDSTRFYDAVVDAIIGIRAYAKTLKDGGIQTKCIIAAFSDGEDNDSQNYKAPDLVKKLADDCHTSEMFYLVYVGFDNDQNDDQRRKAKFEAIASLIGFPNVLTAKNSPSEVRKAMGLVSQSIIRKSQTQIGPSNSFFQ